VFLNNSYICPTQHRGKAK